DDYSGIDPLLAYEAPKDGIYISRIFCFPTTPDSRLGFFGKDNCIYRLTLTTGPYVDRTWPLAVQRDQPAEVELLGWNIPAELRRVPVKSTAKDERVFLQPPGFANGIGLRTEPHRVAEKLGKPPVSASGRLEKPGNRATFSFDGVKGKTLSIALEARDLDLPLDAVLTIRNAAGKTLQRAQAAKLNADPSLDFTPPEDGAYALEVRDLYDEGGPRYSFLVRVRPAQPSFTATLATDRFEGKAKQPLEIPIAVEYRHGMKGPLEVRVQGLPDSAKAEFVAGKDLKKSKVRIQGIDAPLNGPIRLFASAKGQPEQVVLVDEWKEPFAWLMVKEK
ncbi:MAG TPA: PPC domain-containing protein, partial [Gemmataceae bacterium]|nr:PPC domain-containing protein [Gemmataceae bacterium]